MTEREKPAEPDPTREFLDGVRAEETPWRTERPAEQERPEPAIEKPSRWRRAAPYLQAGAAAGWIASAALSDNDDYEDGYDAGFEAGAGGESYGS
ncbi:hypothetical protein [Amycolatopsis albispora]|uniref:Uncharacterized protein n=1 Tax=Amycolatopsis albispora TaxID=1804986 RepID=A0A344LI08_9PSEU|nr:hypothetical protein [Amycolatopsis albispora]AXB47682.1 hypothetical protein A4R43_38830 [Amycolatopsis albispora]